MRALFFRSFVLLFALVLLCLTIVDFMNDDQTVHASGSHAAEPNPLVAKWEGPYGGVPAFDRVEVGLFKPALETAMSENLGEVQSIASNPAAPTFENTIVALETSGRTLERVQTVYNVWGSTMNGPEFQVIQRTMAPKLAAFNDQITQNELLFK
jgi:peptidyl-dipeptidase Dcp